MAQMVEGPIRYCEKFPFLRPLLHSAQRASEFVRDIKAKPITAVKPGDKVWVDLRAEPKWFFGLDERIPGFDLFYHTYVVRYQYKDWVGKGQRLISATCDVLDEFYPRLDSYFVYAYGAVHDLNKATMTVVDRAFVRANPAILSEVVRKRAFDRWDTEEQGGV